MTRHTVRTWSISKSVITALFVAATSTIPRAHTTAQDPAIVTGTVEAFVLPKNAFYSDPASVSDLVRLPYAKVTVTNPAVPQTVFVGESDDLGTFSVPTTFTPSDVTLTVTVTLDRDSEPEFNLSTVADDPPLVLTHTQSADLSFDFTDGALGAFNAAKTEFGTGQTTLFFYTNEVADFANSFSSAFTPPYATPALTGQPNLENQFCTIAGYNNRTVFVFRERDCTDQGQPAHFRNGAVSSFLFHEFSHHFTQEMGFDCLKTDEFFADVMAAYFGDDPRIGKDFFGPGEHRRDLSEPGWIHPAADANCGSGVGTPAFYDRTRPFSGAMWDLRSELIAASPADGADTANHLFFGLLEHYRELGQTQVLLDSQIREDLLAVDAALFDPNHETLIKQVFEPRHICPDTRFLRGDSNRDCKLNISDPSFTLNFLFRGADPPGCDDAVDTNNDGAMNITDPIYLLNYLFDGGPEPPSPLGCPGDDLPGDTDTLTCEASCCPACP